MIDSTIAGIVGDSPAMRALRSLIERAAPLELPVLIQGPTGAGKELVAQALHAASGRSGRCVAVNACAIPEAMFEATLFGHVRGAFTGATADSRGFLEEAHRGSIFLDEIGDLALPLQAKLLRVIETREFRPIGARADRRSAFRTIAATNEPIDALVADGRFRRDLAHRLGGIVIDVPPLRQRLDDIPALVRHFVHSASAGGDDIRLTDGAIHALQDHDWPGNVRELRNAIERALALSDRRRLGRYDIVLALRAGGMGGPAEHRDSFARRRLLKTLEQCAWDTARAATRLGVHRATVYRRMRRLGISTPAAGAEAANGTAEHPLTTRSGARE